VPLFVSVAVTGGRSVRGAPLPALLGHWDLENQLCGERKQLLPVVGLVAVVAVEKLDPDLVERDVGRDGVFGAAVADR
jgi:hypothetical protein